MGLVETFHARQENAITALRSAIEAAEEQEPAAWAKEYAAINEFYGKQTADRSGLLLMRHINDGLHILTLNGASDTAKAAFCLHPLVQNSEVVDVSWSPAYSLACEYKGKANAYLCRPDTDWVSSVGDVQSIVGEMTDDCRAMLIADKRQNYGDFIAAHYGKHSRSKELDLYFRLWLAYLEDTTPPAQPAFVALLVDEARMALFEAINKRDEYGLAALTDDKLILQRLRENGFWIGRLNTPPAAQRKPLTDEEIRKFADTHLFYQPEGYEVSGIFNLARAIEAAHDITGEKT
jgi:hypothetical protein